MGEFIHDDRFWFFQDGITQDLTGVTSFSIGECWLHFYKDCLIGVRDLSGEGDESERKIKRAGYFLDAKNFKWESDGTTSYHEVTPEIVSDAVNDIPDTAGDVRYVSLEELERTAIKMAIRSFERNIDRRLTTMK